MNPEEQQIEHAPVESNQTAPESLNQPETAEELDQHLDQRKKVVKEKKEEIRHRGRRKIDVITASGADPEDIKNVSAAMDQLDQSANERADQKTQELDQLAIDEDSSQSSPIVSGEMPDTTQEAGVVNNTVTTEEIPVSSHVEDADNLPEEGSNLPLEEEMGMDFETEEMAVFKEILEENIGLKESDPALWGDLTKLVKALPDRISYFDSQAADLSREAGFEHIQDKRNEIIKSLCISVLNRHLTGQDVLACVTNIKIITDKAANGQGVCFYRHGSQTLEISKGFLKDHNDGQELDIKHLVNHELSHGVVRFGGPVGATELGQMDAYIEKGKAIVSENLKPAMELIQNATDTKDFQPQHIRNVLTDLENIEDKFNQLKTEDQQKIGGLEGYRRMREVRAAEEIITDYTAYFMESNGSLEDFYEKILNGLDSKAVANYLGQGKTETQVQQWIETIKSRRENGENIIDIAESEPKLKKMIETYTSFYKMTLAHKDKIKGRISTNLPQGDDEDYDLDFDSLDSNYCPDSSESFGKANQSSGGEQGSSILSEIGAFFKSFAEAVDVTGATNKG